MNTKKRLVLASMAVLAVQSFAANAQQDNQLSRCQYVKDKLEEVKEARRSGGSSRYMRYLKKERNRLDKKYSQYQCYRVRSLLK